MIDIRSIMAMARGGGNPQQVLGQLAQQNPQLRDAMQLLSGKNQQQQMQMLRNMAAERGVSLEQIARQMGIRM